MKEGGAVYVGGIISSSIKAGNLLSDVVLRSFTDGGGLGPGYHWCCYRPGEVYTLREGSKKD